MTDDSIMPPSCTILAATIGVTFVGPTNKPLKTMPGFLKINQTRVRESLEWLKKNNPLYKDIVISSDRLQTLPTDGVSLEISELARHSDDTTLLAEETDNYVPDEVTEQHGKHITSIDK